jgi:hypothetical protein
MRHSSINTTPSLNMLPFYGQIVATLPYINLYGWILAHNMWSMSFEAPKPWVSWVSFDFNENRKLE